MKPDLNANPPGKFNLRTLLLAFMYVSLTLMASQSLAKELKQGAGGNATLLSSQANVHLQAINQNPNFECEEDDEVCEILSEICEDDFFCQLLIRICQQDPELCEEILREYFEEECPPDEEDCEEPPECDESEEDCEEPPECDESEEDCQEPPECDESEEDCQEPPECDESEEDCQEPPECDESEEDCQEPPECDESEEDCQEPPECDESEEDCEEPPECDESEEDCQEPPECDESEEDCQEPPECDESEEDCEEPPECDESEEECEDLPPPGNLPDCDEESESEENCEFISGFENPNPQPDMTVMTVDKAAAEQASRFLSQATLGVNYPTITQVAAMGEEVWLEDQFNQPAGNLFPQIDYMVRLGQTFERDEEYYELIGGPEKLHMTAWWTQIMTSPDVLRQRIALALSEIFVISSNVEIIGESPFVVSQYYDTLLNHSFGNFRDLLKDISLNPGMAIYLSHLNNQKADPVAGTFPDENYAREVMQLFSIGLFELNPDGSRKQDAKGNDIPTYGQDEIREFAKIFTGLALEHEEGFGFVPCCDDDFYTHAQTMRPLQMYDAWHSTGEKRLLNGTVVPAGQTGMQDIDAAIDNLFNHPNVGPFIGKQLIQRLVKSNPSPAYVARVTAAFNGETGSPRGDMKAVIRAILMDPEARTAPAEASVQNGRLREPFIRLVRLMRSFNATTSDRSYAYHGFEITAKIKQFVLNAPSVFNFFQPNYSPNGELKDAGLVAPEFQITNASTIIEIKNLVDWWLELGRFEDRVGAMPAEVVTFQSELALANDVDALLDRLDTVMTYGTLSANSRAAIKSVLEAEQDSMRRVKKAVYLMAISPDFAIAL